MTLKLLGKNSFVETAKKVNYTLNTVKTSGDLTIDGTGELYIENGTSKRDLYGIKCYGSFFQKGGKLTVKTGDSTTTKGLYNNQAIYCLLYTSEQESRSSSELVQRIMQYLEENYAQNITLSSLEDAFFFNASYISRVFKQKTGKNYSDYLLSIRLEHAKELLRNSNHSIAYISDTTGFGNSKYFSKIFKEKVGMQPVQYRRTSAR